jgi:hypothetical protein
MEEKLSISRGSREHDKQATMRGMESAVNQTLQVGEERLRCLEQCFALIEDRKV